MTHWDIKTWILCLVWSLTCQPPTFWPLIWSALAHSEATLFEARTFPNHSATPAQSLPAVASTAHSASSGSQSAPAHGLVSSQLVFSWTLSASVFAPSLVWAASWQTLRLLGHLAADESIGSSGCVVSSSGENLKSSLGGVPSSKKMFSDCSSVIVFTALPGFLGLYFESSHGCERCGVFGVRPRTGVLWQMIAGCLMLSERLVWCSGIIFTRK